MFCVATRISSSISIWGMWNGYKLFYKKKVRVLKSPSNWRSLNTYLCKINRPVGSLVLKAIVLIHRTARLNRLHELQHAQGKCADCIDKSQTEMHDATASRKAWSPHEGRSAEGRRDPQTAIKKLNIVAKPCVNPTPFSFPVFTLAEIRDQGVRIRHISIIIVNVARVRYFEILHFGASSVLICREKFLRKITLSHSDDLIARALFPRGYLLDKWIHLICIPQ